MHKKKASVTELFAQGKWMDALDLLNLIAFAKEVAEDAILLQGYTDLTTRQLHDASLGCIIFGYIPPNRLQCVWSLQHPDYQGPCLYPGCSKLRCQGNRLIITNKQPLEMHVHLPHHKNDGVWDNEPITFQLPSALASLLFEWTSFGHKHMCMQLQPQQAPSPYVFMNLKGLPFNTTTLGSYWQKWIKEQGGAPNLRPSRCRHIFVDERLSADRVEGPLDTGAAMAMGNSVSAWNLHYHRQKHFHPKEAQQAVNSMDLWRESLQQSTTPPAAIPAATTSSAASGLLSLVPRNTSQKQAWC